MLESEDTMQHQGSPNGNVHQLGGGTPVTQATSLGFSGKGGELALLLIKTMFLTVITFGIYFVWGQAAIRRYLWSRTAFQRQPFAYHGTGKQVFIAMLKAGAIVFVASALGAGLGSLIADPMAAALAHVIPFAILSFITGPLAFFAMYRFRLLNTTWNGMPFQVAPDYKAFWIHSVKQALLMSITLGIYMPWAMSNTLRFLADRTAIGDARFRYTGNGGAVAKVFFVGVLLSIVTLGIYAPWLMAKLYAYGLQNFWVGSAKSATNFSFRRTGGQLLVEGIVAQLLVIFTFGIGLPWAIVKMMRCFLEGIHQQAPVAIGNAPNPQGVPQQATTFVDRVGEMVANG
jgi:uncharacterized membrane protein YjgN (DUF898 family)